MSAKRNLIVDDDYWFDLGNFFKGRREIEDMLEAYLGVLKESRETAIKDGAAAKELDAYLAYVERLKKKAMNISYDLLDLTKDYVRAIDAADDYLF